MKNQFLFNLYKSQYEHEIERREKIDARLQIPFAVIVAIVGLCSYILKNAIWTIEGFWSLVFIILFSGAVIALGVSLWFFRCTWFGHTDKLLPTPNTLEEYREELKKFYDNNLNATKYVERHMENVLLSYYVEFSSANAKNNDVRSFNIYKTTVSLTISVFMSFFAFMVFHFNGLDRSSVEMQYSVKVLNIEELKKCGSSPARNSQEDSIVTKKESKPVPPPPPPPRNIKSSVDKSKPKPCPPSPPKDSGS